MSLIGPGHVLRSAAGAYKFAYMALTCMGAAYCVRVYVQKTHSVPTYKPSSLRERPAHPACQPCVTACLTTAVHDVNACIADLSTCVQISKATLGKSTRACQVACASLTKPSMRGVFTDTDHIRPRHMMPVLLGALKWLLIASDIPPQLKESVAICSWRGDANP